MEVLSVGEKIKRARIYKGYTLKDVCKNEISVSKLSCIENGKVEPEEWILEFIASKLDLEIEYLKQGVDKQIHDNIKKILKYNKKDTFVEEMTYNLKLAQEYGYYDIALNIMHIIFKHKLETKDIKDMQKLIGIYYDLSNNAKLEYRKTVYYMDVAKYFYSTEEYYQAINYFKNVREAVCNAVCNNEDKKYDLLVDAIYYEVSSYLMIEDYKNAYDIALKFYGIFQYVENDFTKAKMYYIMAAISLRVDKENFKKYELKAYEMFEDNMEYKATAMYNFACTMFHINLKEMALDYIKDAVELYPKSNENKLVDFILKCISKLVENNIIDLAQELSDNAVNLSINLNEGKFIEKAYYLKAKILLEKKDMLSAEMYMNLSLDSLDKFGTKKEIYDRYMEMGKMYYDMNSTSESIKYFSLAMSIQKRL